MKQLRLDPDRIVDCIAEPLLASQIALRRLHADVPEQELDLLQLATTLVAQPGARPTEVMRRHIAEIAGLARLLDNAPDDFRTEPTRGNSPGFVYRAKDRPIDDSRLRHPRLESSGNPEWDWNGPNMTTLADQIGEHPVFFSLLQILNAQCCQFRATQSASQQHGDHGVISYSPEGVPVEYAEQTSSLLGGQPIAHPDAKLLGALDPANSGGEVRTEQTGISGFVCKAADRRQSEVDCRRRIVRLLKENAITGHNGFVEGQARLRAVPFDELPDGMIIRALGTLRCQAVQDGRLRLLQIGQPQNSLGCSFAVRSGHAASLASAAWKGSYRAIVSQVPERDFGTIAGIAEPLRISINYPFSPVLAQLRGAIVVEMLGHAEIGKLCSAIESRFEEISRAETTTGEDPQEVLYRYTSAEGLLGIVRPREICRQVSYCRRVAVSTDGR